VEERCRCGAIDADQFGRCTRGNAGHELNQKIVLNLSR